MTNSNGYRSDEERSDNGGKFSNHIIKTIKLTGTISRNQTRVIGAAQGLYTSLHQPNHHRESVKLNRRIHLGGPEGHSNIDHNGKLNCFFYIPSLAQPGIEDGRGESNKLGDQQCQYQVSVLKADREPVINGHPHYGVDTVNIEPIGK